MVTPLAARLRAASATYLTRPRLLLGVVPVGLATMLAPLDVAGDKTTSASWLFIIMWPACALTWYEWLRNHARWQFTPPRAQLIPGYRRPHRLIMVLLLGALTLLPATVVALLGFPLPAVMLAGIAIGLVAFTQAIPVAIAIGTMFLCFYSRNSAARLDAASRWLWEHPWLANSGGLVVSVVCFALIVRRLRIISQLREDEPGYAAPSGVDSAPSSRTQRRRGEDAVQQISPAVVDRWLRRARRWRPHHRLLLGHLPGLTTGRGTMLAVLGLFTAMGFLTWAEAAADGKPEIEAEVAFIVDIFQLVTTKLTWLGPPAYATLAGFGLAARISMRSADCLLPISRRSYANRLLGFWAASSVVVWGVLSAAGWCAGGWDMPINADPASPVALQVGLLITGACVLFNFGLASLISSTGVTWGQVGVILAVAFVVNGTLMFQWWDYRPRYGWGTLITMAMVVATVGVAMALAAVPFWREREAA